MGGQARVFYGAIPTNIFPTSELPIPMCSYLDPAIARFPQLRTFQLLALALAANLTFAGSSKLGILVAELKTIPFRRATIEVDFSLFALFNKFQLDSHVTTMEAFQ